MDSFYLNRYLVKNLIMNERIVNFRISLKLPILYRSFFERFIKIKEPSIF